MIEFWDIELEDELDLEVDDFIEGLYKLGFKRKNKEIFVKIKDKIDNNPDLIHILKVAFDIEADSGLIEHHAKLIQKSCNTILGLISSA